MHDRDGTAFAGTARYAVERRLGSGSFGVVYAAFDTARGERVALKTLRQVAPASVALFKKEFRALADVVHPHLVTLHDLVADDDAWFFTMELLEGADLLSWLHDAPSGALPVAATQPAGSGDFGDPGDAATAHLYRPPAGDHARLRHAMRQLAEGITALHAAGKLHRDIKPSNVMVTTAGRVVVLDFGLVADLADATEGRLIGTIDYMSPEQAVGQALTPASDWYSFGVVLHQALTGEVPFRGPPFKVLYAKQTEDPVAPGLVAHGVPPDLDALCVRLLARDPAARPTGDEVLDALADPRGLAARPRPSLPASLPPSLPFVGRAAELAALADALAAARRGRPVVAHVHGPSGVGKSALAQRFAEDLARDGALVLQGRCYERESVPYKALDGLIDALARHLAARPAREVEDLLPPAAPVLARLFPALRAVPAIARASLPTAATPPDPQELRRAAAGALRDLLAALASRAPMPLVALVLEDLQWGDADSATVLSEVLRAPRGGAGLLLVLTWRAAARGASPCVQSLLADHGDAAEVREVALAGLGPSDATALAVTALAGRAAQAEAVAREAGGNPFFIYELARYLQSPDGEGALARHGEVTLEAVLRARLARLPGEALRLLHVVALSGQPVPEAVAAEAAEVKNRTAALGALRAGNLVRTLGTGADHVMTFHDRIRECVVAGLAPDAQRAGHGRLARALEGDGRAEPETLAYHFEAAGARDEAGRYAAAAAERASAALAFDRAAALYRRALELRPQEAGAGDAGRRLRAGLGAALANAGRGPEAARAYLAACEGAAPAARLEYQRRAAEQLLHSGYIDEGTAVIREVLGAVGLRLAETPRQALLSLLGRRAWIRVRGLGFTERGERAIPPDQLLKIDACWSVATGLGLVDTVRGADLQALNLTLALRAGEPYRVARALAVEAAYLATTGRTGRRRAAALMETARSLAVRLDHPHALGLAEYMAALCAWCEGRWGPCRERAEGALAILRERCTGVAWERGAATILALDALAYLGEWGEIARRLPSLLADAQDRGDIFLETMLRVRYQCLAGLAADDPARALDGFASIARWSRAGFHSLHLVEMHERAEVALYAGDGAGARAGVAARWPALEGSLLLRVEPFRVQMHGLRARCALAAARSAGGARRAALLAEAARDAATVEAAGLAWSTPLAWLVRAGVAAARGEDARGLYAQAAAGFDAAGMALHAAAARRRLGDVAAADEAMTARRIRNPAAVAEMLAPDAG